ncbi:SPW repeat protein [Streptacidiphilus monticola]
MHFRAANPDLAVNNLIIGLGLAAIGMGLSVAGDRMFRLSWACTLIGVWMIISPWVVTPGHSPNAGMIWNNVVIGVIACLCGLAATGLVLGSAGGGLRRRRAAR